MEEIQSCWQVPAIAHFCNLFKNYFGLPEFDYEELEYAFLSSTSIDLNEPGFTTVVGSDLLRRLIIALLSGYFDNQIINSLNWESFLKKLFQIQKVDVEKRRSPFVSDEGQDLSFDQLSFRSRVEIVYNLCEYRLYNDVTCESLKDIIADEYRIEPLATDRDGNVYWYFYGTRLYRENSKALTQIEEKQRKIEEIRKKAEEAKQKIEDQKRKEREKEELARLKEEEEARKKAEKEAELEAKKAEKEAEKVEEPKSAPRKRGLAPKVLGFRSGLRDRSKQQAVVVNGVVNQVSKSDVPTVETPKRQPSKRSAVIALNNQTKAKQAKQVKVKEIEIPTIPVIELSEYQEAWCIICSEEQDWINLEEKFKKSKVKCEVEFYELIRDNFIPIIVDIFAKREKDKQRIERQKLFDLLPRRTSSRIEIKKIQKEQEELEDQEEKKKREEEEKERKKLEKLERDRIRQEKLKLEREKRSEQRLAIMEERAKRAKSRDGLENGLVNGLTMNGLEDAFDAQLQSDETNSSECPDGMKFPLNDTLDLSSKENFYEGLEKVIYQVNLCRDSWPFKEPVDEKAVPMYYQVIEKPIDLKKIERKIDCREYSNLEEVELDFKLLVNNCEVFNGERNGYTIMVYAVWRAFKRAVRKHLNTDVSLDENVAFMYPPRPFNAKPVAAIEAKKKRSRNKRKQSLKALDVLAQAAEKAVKDTSSCKSSSLASTSPRSSFDERTNDSFYSDNPLITQTTSFQANAENIMSRFLLNSNSANSNVNISSNNNVTPSINTSSSNLSSSDNLTFKSLEEWSKSIKQSGSSIILPQNAVIISSSPVTNTCTTNGPNPLFKQASEKMFAFKMINSSPSKATGFTSLSAINGNINDETIVTSPDAKRIVIKLSKQGQAWKPIDSEIKPNSCLQQSTTSVLSQSTSISPVKVNSISNLNNLSLQSHSPSSSSSGRSMDVLPNKCVPVKKRVYLPSIAVMEAAIKREDLTPNLDHQSDNHNHNHSLVVDSNGNTSHESLSSSESKMTQIKTVMASTSSCTITSPNVKLS